MSSVMAKARTYTHVKSLMPYLTSHELMLPQTLSSCLIGDMYALLKR